MQFGVSHDLLLWILECLHKSECVVSVAIFIPFGREYICKVCFDAWLEHSIYALKVVLPHFVPNCMRLVLNQNKFPIPNISSSGS